MWFIRQPGKHFKRQCDKRFIVYNEICFITDSRTYGVIAKVLAVFIFIDNAKIFISKRNCNGSQIFLIKLLSQKFWI